MYVGFFGLYLKYVGVTEGCFLSWVLWEVCVFFTVQSQQPDISLRDWRIIIIVLSKTEKKTVLKC